MKVFKGQAVLQQTNLPGIRMELMVQNSTADSLQVTEIHSSSSELAEDPTPFPQ